MTSCNCKADLKEIAKLEKEREALDERIQFLRRRSWWHNYLGLSKVSHEEADETRSNVY